MRRIFIPAFFMLVLLIWSCAPTVTNLPPNTPSNPNPVDNATGVSIDVTLSWSCSDPDGDSLTYDIYFGTSSSLSLVKSDHTSNTYDPGTLQYSTTYYWKIVAKDGRGEVTEGPVWRFTTMQESESDQAPNIEWQKALGGSNDDEAYSVQQTSDGGYIVAGSTRSNDGDVSGNHEEVWWLVWDFWVVKLDRYGDIEWQKCLGGSDSDWAESIQQTSDGGYIVAGYTGSNDGDVSGNHGEKDFWVVKLDRYGNIKWQKALGGSDSDWAYNIQQTSDGEYIVAGYTGSNDGDVSGNHGEKDFWVVKLDRYGNIEWQKCLGGSGGGGSGGDYAYSVQQTSDGGYIVAGETWSNNGDVSGYHGGGDVWVVKLDRYGDIKWQKCLGGSSWDWAYSIQQTNDGGYIVAGLTRSNDGDVSGNHGEKDFWVVKLGE